jgi:hypothetical protein
MSGQKESDYRLEAERAEELRRQQRLAAVRSEIKGLADRIETLLGQASPGLQKTFLQQVDAARAWLRQVRDGERRTSRFSSETDLADRAAAGRARLNALSVALTETASQIGRSLAAELANAEGLLIGHRELLEGWYGKEQTDGWQTSLSDARRRLQRDEFEGLDQMLGDTQSAIRQQAEQAAQREDQYQRREYLLAALRQVCAEMGFREVAAPEPESPGVRDSRIRFEVDTLDRGRIVFHLALDSIQSDCPMLDRHCFEEFGRLSQSLMERFGVQTNFKPRDGRIPSKRRAKGELDEPHSGDKQIELPAR